jgi:hypothetical protein
VSSTGGIVSALDLLKNPVNKNKNRIKVCVFKFNLSGIFVSIATIEKMCQN